MLIIVVESIVVLSKLFFEQSRGVLEIAFMRFIFDKLCVIALHDLDPPVESLGELTARGQMKAVFLVVLAVD